MQDGSIVSHVASQEYRAGIDGMTCAVPGCKRWRVDDRTELCSEHLLGNTYIAGLNHTDKPCRVRSYEER